MSTLLVGWLVLVTLALSMWTVVRGLDKRRAAVCREISKEWEQKARHYDVLADIWDENESEYRQKADAARRESAWWKTRAGMWDSGDV